MSTNRSTSSGPDTPTRSSTTPHTVSGACASATRSARTRDTSWSPTGTSGSCTRQRGPIGPKRNTAWVWVRPRCAWASWEHLARSATSPASSKRSRGRPTPGYGCAAGRSTNTTTYPTTRGSSWPRATAWSMPTPTGYAWRPAMRWHFRSTPTVRCSPPGWQPMSSATGRPPLRAPGSTCARSSAMQSFRSVPPSRR